LCESPGTEAGPKELCGALIAAVIAATVVLSSCSSSGPQNLLPRNISFNPGTSQNYSPAGLDASMMLPSSWHTAPLTENAQYAMESQGHPVAFVIAGRYGGVLPTTLSQLVSARTKFLAKHDARITSTDTGVVDGLPAARFTYRINAPTAEVADIEYDVLTTSPLAAGANQHQTVYSDVEILLVTSESAAAGDKPMFDWIASTIKVH
jgi:hypothetical protein